MCLLMYLFITYLINSYVAMVIRRYIHTYIHTYAKICVCVSVLYLCAWSIALTFRQESCNCFAPVPHEFQGTWSMTWFPDKVGIRAEMGSKSNSRRLFMSCCMSLVARWHGTAEFWPGENRVIYWLNSCWVLTLWIFMTCEEGIWWLTTPLQIQFASTRSQ